MCRFGATIVHAALPFGPGSHHNSDGITYPIGPSAPLAAMPAWQKMTEGEVKLAKKWYVDGETTAEIADRLSRDQSTITRLLVKRVPRKKQGRKALLDEAINW